MFQCQHCEYWNESAEGTAVQEHERQGDCTCPKWKLRSQPSGNKGNRSNQDRELSDASVVTRADFSCGFFQYKSVPPHRILVCSRCSKDYTRDYCDYLIDGKHVCVKCKKPGERHQIAFVTLPNVEIVTCTVLGCSSSTRPDAND